jgi:3-hydroxyacyl-[acyl-carrier-protein] dehydratase
LESFGQAAALLWLLGQSEEQRRAGGMLLLGGARKCVFFAHAFPGDVLRHEVRLVHATVGAAFADGEIYVGETCLSQITSMAAVQRAREAISGRR